MMTRTYGLDFSADQNRAGHKIWVAELVSDGDAFTLAGCATLCELTGCSPKRDASHAALVNWIKSLDACVVGCDFPFGVPRVHLGEHTTWAAWLRGFTPDPSTPLQFWKDAQLDVVQATGGTRKELRRTTDTLTQTPMAPLNRRVFFQTFFGLQNVLRPLTLAGDVNVAPMVSFGADVPTLIEVCPGSLIKRHGALREATAGRPYKGRSAQAKRARDAVVRFLIDDVQMRMASSLARQLRQDPEADAIDAALSAWCAWRHRDRLDALAQQHRADALREGWVYV